MVPPAHPPAHEPRDMVRVLYNLVDGVSRAPSAEAIYDQALTALMSSVMPDRASVLSFDDAGAMRFRAWRHLADWYRAAVDGPSAWRGDATNPESVVTP